MSGNFGAQFTLQKFFVGCSASAIVCGYHNAISVYSAKSDKSIETFKGQSDKAIETFDKAIETFGGIQTQGASNY